jgi:hypothetical protein
MLTVAQLNKKLISFVEPEASLLQVTTEPHSEPDISLSLPYIIFVDV